jgi:hypothetical protein
MIFWLGFAKQQPGAGPPRQPHANQVTGGQTEGSPEEAPEEEEESVGEEVNTAMLNFLPWFLSFMGHAGIIILAIFIVWATIRTAEEEQPIVPVARLSKNPGAPVTQTQTKKRSSQSNRSQTRSVSKAQSNAKSNLTSKKSNQSTLIGVAGGSGGAASPFGTSGNRGSGQFKASFFGTGGNAKKLAYLIDASGSLIDVLPFVIQELKRSIGELSEKQSFTVIFFQAERAREVPPPGLKNATSQVKQKVMQWVDTQSMNIIPMGATNPVAGLEKALAAGPQLLFLLSDNITGQGRYEIDQRRLLAQIRLVNRKQTKINTIQFLYPDPLVAVGMKATMELIAERTNGVYKYLDPRELGIE